MDSTIFITSKLAEFASQFSTYSYKYWMDDSKENHFIEVFPSSYKISEEFIDQEVALLELFYESYFNESLSFITSTDIGLIGNVNLVKCISASFNWEDHTVKIASSNVENVNNYRLTESYLSFNLAAAA